EHTRTAAALASTLGLRLPEDPLGSLDPRELYHELVGAWRVLLASLAHRTPVVAVVEDIHWADPTLLDVLDELAERLDGPIVFLEEIVRHLINEELLVWEGERWRASAGIEQVAIPDNVQAVILARLDLLAPDERRLAQRAAVVGRVFWDGALARLVQLDDLDGALRTLRRREFVLERVSSSIPGQREFAFK